MPGCKIRMLQAHLRTFPLDLLGLRLGVLGDPLGVEG